MKTAAHPVSVTFGALLAGVIALSACSGSSEDVRITFCKNLTKALVDSPKDAGWREPVVRIKRPEFAAVTVEPDAYDQGASATCYFQYDLVDETAVDHANPILAYSTLPYRMTLEGRELSRALLTKITSDEQIRQGKLALDRIKRVTRDAADLLKKTAGETWMFARQAPSDAAPFNQEAAANKVVDLNQAPPHIKERPPR